jgi:ornithine carbamoyltransferase
MGLSRPAASIQNGERTMPSLHGRSFLKEIDFTEEEFLSLIDLAGQLRCDKQEHAEHHALRGCNIALIFEKTSTRTRAAFEVAAHDQGAHVSYLGPGETQLGKKESIRDTARVLGRMYDGIEFRGFAQRDVEDLAQYSGVPVWNGLTDQWHPTQMLADMLTMRDHAAGSLPEVSYCYLGDARNNTANSLLVTGALLGLDVRICAPPLLQPSGDVQRIARELAQRSGARVTVTGDIEVAVAGAAFLYTDVWLSMGEPTEEWPARIAELAPYRITKSVMDMTGNPGTRFMHCLPAMHNRETEVGQMIFDKFGLDALEVTDEVFESPASIVFDQAENRLHTIKAVMVATLGHPEDRP